MPHLLWDCPLYVGVLGMVGKRVWFGSWSGFVVPFPLDDHLHAKCKTNIYWSLSFLYIYSHLAYTCIKCPLFVGLVDGLGAIAVRLV